MTKCQLHRVSKKWATFIFTTTWQKGTKFHIFFTVKFRKDQQEKLELKLPCPLKSVAALPCEKQGVNYTPLQHSYISSKW